MCLYASESPGLLFKMQNPCPHPTNESESLRGEGQESALPDDPYISQSLKKNCALGLPCFVRTCRLLSPQGRSVDCHGHICVGKSPPHLVMWPCILLVGGNSILVNALGPVVQTPTSQGEERRETNAL